MTNGSVKDKIIQYLLQAVGTLISTAAPAGEKFIVAIFPLSPGLKDSVWLVAAIFSLISSLVSSTIIHEIVGPVAAILIILIGLIVFSTMYYVSTAEVAVFSAHIDNVILGISYISIFTLFGILVGVGVRKL